MLEQDGQFHLMIRQVLVANLHAHTPNICIEVGRQATPGHARSSFEELEEALKAAKEAA